MRRWTLKVVTKLGTATDENKQIIQDALDAAGLFEGIHYEWTNDGLLCLDEKTANVSDDGPFDHTISQI